MRMTQLSKRAEGRETSLHSFSDSCCYYKLVCVLPLYMFISLQRRRRWVGKPRATPGHPQNKGRVVLLKSGTEAKLLPPEKGGNGRACGLEQSLRVTVPLWGALGLVQCVSQPGMGHKPKPMRRAGPYPSDIATCFLQFLSSGNLSS